MLADIMFEFPIFVVIGLYSNFEQLFNSRTSWPEQILGLPNCKPKIQTRSRTPDSPYLMNSPQPKWPDIFGGAKPYLRGLIPHR